MKEFPCKKSIIISVISVQSYHVMASHSSQAITNLTKTKGKQKKKETKQKTVQVYSVLAFPQFPQEKKGSEFSHVQNKRSDWRTQ